tara:strand:+ start:263 stop:688 length:426 start_codon:yes stop_codon:yes gene_type:complete
MDKACNLLIVALFIFNSLGAQNNHDLKKYGFITISTDSMNVPLFVDGFYVGNHPLKGPVPVLPGFHEVSYIPPDIQDETVRKTLTEGTKRIYVAENDTLDVFLFYDHYLTQVETLQQELQVQNYIGFTLFIVLLFVMLRIF